MTVDISIVVFRPDFEELGRTFQAIAAVRTEFDRLRLLVSGDSEVHRRTRELLAEAGVDAVVSERFDNLGFSTGHNRLLAESFRAGADACLVLNPDARIEPGALTALVAAVSSDGAEGLYGPALRRADTAKVDSLGVEWTRDARHFDRAMGEPFLITPGRIDDVEGLTGACLFVTRSAYERIVRRSGWFFDDAFLAYREDAELGVRARALGVPSRLVHIEGFSHVRAVRGYQRGRVLPDLLGVRNRFLLKYRLGVLRPGSRVISAVRDLAVIGAVHTIERRSKPGWDSARRIRRFVRGTSTVLPGGAVSASGGAPLKVVYLGVESLDYPRNARIRDYLERELGARVSVVPIDKDPGALRKARVLLRDGRAALRGGADVLILAEFQNKYALVARYLAWRARALLITDWFVGLHETRVGDWKLHAPTSMRARLLDLTDRIAARAGDLVITDTDARANDLTERYGTPESSLLTLPVGAPGWAGAASAREVASRPRLKVLYYGGYLPLHGVDYVLDAVKLVDSAERVEVVLLGAGQLRDGIERRVAQERIPNVTFLDPVPEESLAGLIADADVVLGVFGRSRKAETVIANKVWQGLASGKTVVTRTSPALDEISAIVGDLLVTVDPEDPASLAAFLNDAMRRPPTPTAGNVAERLEEYVRKRYVEFGTRLSEEARK